MIDAVEVFSMNCISFGCIDNASMLTKKCADGIVRARLLPKEPLIEF